jgi:hypothetical protein
MLIGALASPNWVQFGTESISHFNGHKLAIHRRFQLLYAIKSGSACVHAQSGSIQSNGTEFRNRSEDS